MGSAARPAGPALKQPGERACNVPVAGLKNLGNTCYLNAVLQALFGSPEFCKLLQQQRAEEAESQRSDSSSPAPGAGITAELGALFDALSKAPFLPGPQDPTVLLSKLRERHPIFRSAGQHDAQVLIYE